MYVQHWPNELPEREIQTGKDDVIDDMNKIKSRIPSIYPLAAFLPLRDVEKYIFHYESHLYLQKHPYFQRLLPVAKLIAVGKNHLHTLSCKCFKGIMLRAVAIKSATTTGELV